MLLPVLAPQRGATVPLKGCFGSERLQSIEVSHASEDFRPMMRLSERLRVYPSLVDAW